ncbi:glycosyltransferase family 87 protein [Pseudonocardia acaciae]|uniref:glycosyltransferase family 87 protein n=1 Tax=Pseudonocardia acaciae TaxID=551276 RepID=UPI000685C65B|nr:glycosyltransferase 87 family protein [Pseudonocardia acaciae]
MTGQTRRRLGGAGLLLLVLLTWLTMLASFENKARCIGPVFDSEGRSGPDYDVRKNRDLCYTDVQELWLGRDINRHVVPYVNGAITEDGTLVGGTVEYPVLSGMLIWAGALFANTDGGFMLGTALLLAPFGLVTAWLLGRLSRWRALLWALGPPLFLYAFHNWDLPAVACAVGAVAVLHGWRTPDQLVRRATWAGVLLGLGFAFKIYPGVFVAPLALYVLTRGTRAGALRVVAASIATVIAVNLPFAVLGYEGWRASFTYQQLRTVDATTNSIWYWGFRPASDPENEAFQALADRLSPALVLLSFAVALGVGWWRYRRTGVYPWVQVSAAMLAGFLLLHKVHSPQYALWLLPFFVLLRVRWGWIAGYLAADAAIGLGIFRWFYTLRVNSGYQVYDGLAAQAVVVGVWGRAALLVALFGVFLAAETTFDDAADDRTEADSAPGEDRLLEVGHPGRPAV